MKKDFNQKEAVILQSMLGCKNTISFPYCQKTGSRFSLFE
jgi:hypothetical protein